MQALPRDGAEEALELVVVLAQHLQHEEERVLGRAGEFGGRDRREDMEGDGWIGRGNLLDLAGAQCGRLEGRRDDHHGDVVAVADEDLGELGHGIHVANAGAGVQDDGLLHLLKSQAVVRLRQLETRNKYF